MDGRFYVLSLMAIFLSLALGILLGVHLPGAEAMLVSEELLVSRLEREFAIMTEERMQLYRQLDELLEEKHVLESSLRDLTGQVVEGLLEDTVVGVILSAGFDQAETVEVKAGVQELLRAAGAQVRVTDPQTLPVGGRPADVKLLVYPEGAGAVDEEVASLFPHPVLGQWGRGNVVTATIPDHAPVIPGVSTYPGNVSLVRTLAETVRERGEVREGGFPPSMTNK